MFKPFAVLAALTLTGCVSQADVRAVQDAARELAQTAPPRLEPPSTTPSPSPTPS